MQDKLYVPAEILEQGYKYVDFNNGYVDLYNKPYFRDETATYYRIYYNCSSRNLYTRY